MDIANEIPIKNKEAEKIIKTTGFSHIRQVINETTKDLCLKAARKILENLTDNEKDDIDVILFVSQTRDYVMPQTSGIIQYELGLKTNIVCKDIPLGCSGYIYGLMEAYMFASLGAKSILLLAGDTSTKLISKNDKTVSMVFGDGGTATLIKSQENSDLAIFDFGNDGEKFNDLIIPYGGMKNPTNNDSCILKDYEPGISRSDNDLFMDGFSIMNFAIKRVPKSISNVSVCVKEKIDRYYLHQANKFMIDYLVKKMKIDKSLVPFTANEIGNTGPASIPIAICIDFLNGLKPKKAILSGFGVGLSWATCNVDLSKIEYSHINL